MSDTFFRNLVHESSMDELMQSFYGTHDEPSRCESLTPFDRVRPEKLRAALEHYELRQILRDAYMLFSQRGGKFGNMACSLVHAKFSNDGYHAGDLAQASRVIFWDRISPGVTDINKRAFPLQKECWVEIALNRDLSASAFHEAWRKTTGGKKPLMEELIDRIVACASRAVVRTNLSFSKNHPRRTCQDGSSTHSRGRVR